MRRWPRVLLAILSAVVGTTQLVFTVHLVRSLHPAYCFPRAACLDDVGDSAGDERAPGAGHAEPVGLAGVDCSPGHGLSQPAAAGMGRLDAALRILLPAARPPRPANAVAQVDSHRSPGVHW